MSRAGRIIRHLSIFTALLAIAFLNFNCGPSGKKPGEEAAPTLCTPSNLTVRTDDGTMSLRWDMSCPDTVALSGYFVYLSPYSLQELAAAVLPDSIKPYNNAPYPGDTNPDRTYETMELSNLENGVPYYVSIRTVYPDQTVSAASNEVKVYCRPEGEFTLDMRFVADHDGFDFSAGQYARADGDRNDIYYYRVGSSDFIASPHRLNGYIRESLIYSLGPTTDIYQYPELNLDIDGASKIPIREGESYLIKTADGNYAKVRVDEIIGVNRERKIKMSYIYQTTPDLMEF